MGDGVRRLLSFEICVGMSSGLVNENGQSVIDALAYILAVALAHDEVEASEDGDRTSLMRQPRQAVFGQDAES